MKFFLTLFIIKHSLLSSLIYAPYNTNIKAVIFDCDGVIVDTEFLKYLAWQNALLTQNISFSLEEYKPLVGHSSKNILLGIQKLKSLEISEDIIHLKNLKYKELQSVGVPPINEMIDFIRELHSKKDMFGIKIGLASSAPRAEILENLNQINLREVFDVIVSGSCDLQYYIDTEGTNKPKPYIYLETAKRLGVSPSECLVFEDTEAGIQAASVAGMVTIAIPNQFTGNQNFSKATKVIRSYLDLPIFQKITPQSNK